MDYQPPANPPRPNVPPVTDEEIDRQARTDYLRSVVPKRRKHQWPKIFLITLGILLLAGAVYWKFGQDKSKPTPSSNATTSQSQKAPTPQANVPTKAYTSANFSLSFNYPQTWTVTDSGNGQLTVVSPATSLTDSSGQNITGQITMTIRQKGQGLTAFDKGNGTAVLDSQKVSYSNPTSSQRAQTYLTYVQFPATTTMGALDAIYITGDFGYQKGQAVPKVDLSQIDPLVSITFAKCTDNACSTATPTNIEATSWTGTTASPTETMLKSLSFE
jgi:hypothetical protein